MESIKIVSFFLVSTPVLLNAGVVPGRWEKVEALTVGSPVVVSSKSETRIEAKFRGLRAEAIDLTDESGKDLQIPRSEVLRITTRGSKDGLSDGAWIGGGIGVAVAVGVLAIAGSGEGEVVGSAKWGAPLLFGGVGALTGALVDNAYKDEEIIYKAP